MLLLNQKHTEGIQLFSPTPADLAKKVTRAGQGKLVALAKDGRSNFAGTASSQHRRICEALQQMPTHAIMYRPARSIARGVMRANGNASS